MTEFFTATWNVLLDLAPWLLLGAGIAGLLQAILPQDFLARHFSGSRGVLKSVVFGVPLPICSCGVIPVAASLKKSGGSDGATVAFLISTPQTGVDSALVSASFLGWPFAIFKVVSAAVTGFIGGWWTDVGASSRVQELTSTDPVPQQTQHRFRIFWGHSLEMLQSIWRWIVVGVLVSAAIETFVPDGAFTGLAGYGGLAAMLVTLVIALPLYVCATASVPIAAALVGSGLPVGAALVFLMAGPATNVATLGAVYRTLGRRPLTIYLTTVVVGSILAGWAFGFVIDANVVSMHHEHDMNTWWSVASVLVLLALIGWFAFEDVRQFMNRNSRIQPTNQFPALEVPVAGMKCDACVARLEKSLTSDANIDSATVALEPGIAIVHGSVSQTRVRQLVEAAGFSCPE